jgi:urease accessory protein
MTTRRVLTLAPTCLAAGVVAVLVVATPAAAHTGRGPGGVLDGVLHPITGPDHLMAMLAVGVVAAIAAPRGRVWLAPAAFVGGMIAGGIAGIAGAPLPGAEHLIMASVFALGIAIAGAAAGGGGDWLLAALIVAGVAHGHAHGAEAPDAANPFAYVTGFVAATTSLHLVGVGVGMFIRDHRTVRAGLGAATVAGGALLLV